MSEHPTPWTLKVHNDENFDVFDAKKRVVWSGDLYEHANREDYEHSIAHWRSIVAAVRDTHARTREREWREKAEERIDTYLKEMGLLSSALAEGREWREKAVTALEYYDRMGPDGEVAREALAAAEELER